MIRARAEPLVDPQHLADELLLFVGSGGEHRARRGQEDLEMRVFAERLL